MYNNFSQQNRIVYHHMFFNNIDVMHVTAMTSRDNINHRHCPYFIFLRNFFFYSPRNYKYNVHSSRRYQPERNLYSALRMWHMKPTLQLKVIYLRIDIDFLHFFLSSTLLNQNPDSIVLISSILNSLCFWFSIKWNKILNENIGSF